MKKTLYRHKKRGGLYEILDLGPANLQLDGPDDGAEVVIYRSHQDGRIWVRKKYEFFDGRFEEVTPA